MGYCSVILTYVYYFRYPTVNQAHVITNCEYIWDINFRELSIQL